MGIVAASAITLRPLVRALFSHPRSIDYSTRKASVPRKPSLPPYLRSSCIIGASELGDLEMGPDIPPQISTTNVGPEDNAKYAKNDSSSLSRPITPAPEQSNGSSSDGGLKFTTISIPGD